MAETASEQFLRPAVETSPRRVRLNFSELIHINWALFIGGLVVLFVVVVAVWGPRIAPKDPMETAFASQGTDGVWYRPPFPPNAVEGFPLGTDNLGRDVLSRLLWGVRPTLTVVGMAAAIRLLVGLVLGSIAGWSSGRVGRFIDSLIAASLTVPVLLIALAVITALTVKLGLWAFVVGMTVTGWAETGRIVREQTRSIKSQTYVEAATALGGSSFQIVTQHVLRQIAPLLWMVLAFEVSATLLVMAALGFLGYYVGGDIWIPVADFVYGRFSGSPELGEMLGGSLGDLFTGPWKFIAAGTMVFVTVLGFNLLGEGLRRQFSTDQMRRRTVFSRLTRRFGVWADERIMIPVSVRLSSGRVRAALLVLALLLVAGGVGLRRAREAASVVPIVELPIPGNHLWASQARDAYGTGSSTVQGISDPTVTVVFEEPTGFSGGPAIDADGRLYITSTGGTLYALSPEGAVEWQATLPAPPVGAPALGAEGQVYVADKVGGLSAYSPTGESLWSWTPETAAVATAGPIVGQDGTIYYTVGGAIQAVSTEGDPLWLTNATIRPTNNSPVIDPTGQIVAVGGGSISTEDGTKVNLGVTQAQADQYLVGGDGRAYLRADHVATEWQFNGETAEALRTIESDNQQQFAYSTPLDAGITRDRIMWMTFGNDYEDARLVWVSPKGVLLGTSYFPHRPSTNVIATDVDSTTYACGNRQNRGEGTSFTVETECLAFEPGAATPTWSAVLPGSGDNPYAGSVVGGALIPERLYVATASGMLFSIGAPQ